MMDEEESLAKAGQRTFSTTFAMRIRSQRSSKAEARHGCGEAGGRTICDVLRWNRLTVELNIESRDPRDAVETLRGGSAFAASLAR